MASPVVAVAVSPIRSARSTPARRRQITPSAEASSSKHSLILTTPRKKPWNLFLGGALPTQPYFAPRQLFPQGAATVDAIQNLHAHPLAAPTPHQNIGRHVLLPFDLRDRTISLDHEDIRPVLYNVFPGTLNVAEGRQRSVLLFQVEKLPEKPWPLTVGGVPVTITDGTEGRGPLFPKQKLVASNIQICSHFAEQDLSSSIVLRNLVREVNELFQKNLPGVRLLEFMCTKDETFYAILANEVSLNAIRDQLPARIANRLVGYMRDEELGRPQWADLPAKRLINPRPTEGIIDDTPYDVLRPGVIICSQTFKDNAHPAWFSTTSGVQVENSAGDRFMTAASHGIGVNERVWQIASQGMQKLLGKAVQEISFTDVSLVQLEQDIIFTNETFENSAGEVPRFTRLFGEDPTRDRIVGGNCYLNSPYTGNMDGVVVMNSIKLERSSHPTEDALRYVLYNWAYMGQEEGDPDKERPPDGTCGSVIWDDDGVLLGFYRYYIAKGPFAGFAAAVNASEVVNAGYRLAR
ncbi:hypothetical protein INS49_004479 [Diaporthe citri]|uniref:uncharacterized protein n=1 Tax=Diaporthe citri TaxID=83186 RepID=UPI001C80CFC0|nr:uncharacterized protein INS49_004479 [Diaporthe citri]KAG6354462.1 hypothetical protein INS49_004479 [Diaporthe citri]